MEGRLSGFPYLILNPISSTEAAKPTMHVFRANERLGTSMAGERRGKSETQYLLESSGLQRTDGGKEGEDLYNNQHHSYEKEERSDVISHTSKVGVADRK